jgi:outer membrane lipoprotein-sorting protein
MTTRLVRALFAALLIAAAAPAVAIAAPPKTAQLSDQDRADLQRIQQWLNGIKTMSARFTQYTDSGTAEGVLYLRRPGNMRFEYDAPTPYMLLANGTWVIYYDKSVDQVSYLPISSTPAWFLLRDDVKLGGDVTVTGFERGPGVVRVTLVQSNEPDSGRVTLTVTDKPLELKQWTLTDPQGKRTTVTLNDPRYGEPVDPKLFVFNDPRPLQGYRRGGSN